MWRPEPVEGWDGSGRWAHGSHRSLRAGGLWPCPDPGGVPRAAWQVALGLHPLGDSCPRGGGLGQLFCSLGEAAGQEAMPAESALGTPHPPDRQRCVGRGPAVSHPLCAIGEIPPTPDWQVTCVSPAPGALGS